MKAKDHALLKYYNQKPANAELARLDPTMETATKDN